MNIIEIQLPAVTKQETGKAVAYEATLIHNDLEKSKKVLIWFPRTKVPASGIVPEGLVMDQMYNALNYWSERQGVGGSYELEFLGLSVYS